MPGHSGSAKVIALLDASGYPYAEFSVEDEESKRRLSDHGFRTVPQTFINERHIGGYDELERFLKRIK